MSGNSLAHAQSVSLNSPAVASGDDVTATFAAGTSGADAAAVTWVWERATAEPPQDDDDWAAIPGADTDTGAMSTYTAVAADEGWRLRAVASYTVGMETRSAVAATDAAVADGIPPRPTITTEAKDGVTTLIEFTIDFGEEVFDFEVTDIVVAHGSTDQISWNVGTRMFDRTPRFVVTDAAAGVYTVTVNPDRPGDVVTVNIATGAARDGGNNPSEAAAEYRITAGKIVVNFGTESVTVTEPDAMPPGTTAGTVRVTLSRPISAPLDGDFRTLRVAPTGTWVAEPGVDFADDLGSTGNHDNFAGEGDGVVTFYGGEMGLTFTVTARADSFWEGPETATYAFATTSASWDVDSTFAVGTAQPTVPVTVIDAAPPATVVLRADWTRLAEQGGVMNAALTYGLVDADGMEYEFPAGYELQLMFGGTAERGAGKDYMVSGRVLESTGSPDTRPTVTVTVLPNDDTAAGFETVTVDATLTNARGGTVDGITAPSPLTLRIEEAAPAGPAAEPTVTATTGVGFGLRVMWAAPVATAELAGYVIGTRLADATGPFTERGQTDAVTLAYTIRNLVETQRYAVAVRARYEGDAGVGLGQWSPASAAVSPNEPPVLTPSATTVMVTEGHTAAVVTYELTDPDTGSSPQPELVGVDAGHFTLDTAQKMVTFRTPPRHGNPQDVGGDNVYHFTLTYSDDGGLTARADVAVTVAAGTPATVTLDSAADAASGDDVTATFAAGTSGADAAAVTWVWERATAEPPQDDDDWAAIPGADTDTGAMSTYTAVAADEGWRLRAVASYTVGMETRSAVAATDAAVADGIPPTVADLSITSTPVESNTYRRSETIAVRVRFSEPVQLTGTAGIALGISNGADVYAEVSDDGTTAAQDTWDFTYVVAADVVDTDNGVDIVENTLVLRNADSGDHLFQDDAENSIIAMMNPAFAPTPQQNIDGNQTHAPTTVDIVGPDMTLTTNAPINVTITFNRAVVGFTAANIDVNGGNEGALAVTTPNKVFTLAVTPTVETGTLTVTVDADQVGWVDLPSVLNARGVYTVSVATDQVAPTATIHAPARANAAAFQVVIDFGEPVTGFMADELLVTDGTAANFQPTDSTQLTQQFTANVTANESATEVILQVGDGAAEDETGNQSMAAVDVRVEIDRVTPTPNFMAAISDFLVNEAFDLTIDFGEALREGDELVASDLTPTGATLGTLRKGSAVGQFIVSVTPTVETGTFTVAVANAAVTDIAGNESSMDTFTGTVIPVTASISRTGTGATAVGPFVVAIAFSHAVSGFTVNNAVTVSDGAEVTAHRTATTNQVWHMLISPERAGTVTVRIASGAGTVTRNNASSPAASETFTVELLDVSFERPSYNVTEGNSAGVNINVMLEQRPENLSGLPQDFELPLVFAGQTTRLPEGVTVSRPTGNAWRVLNGYSLLRLERSSDTTRITVVPAVADSLWAPDKAIGLALPATSHVEWPLGFAHGTQDSTTITVQDSLDPPAIALSVSHSALAEVAGVSNATITATITPSAMQGYLAEELTLNLDFTTTGSNLAARGTDQNTGDYYVDSPTITLPPNATPSIAPITLRVRMDTEDENTEEITFGAHVTDDDDNRLDEFDFSTQTITIHEALVASIVAAPTSVTEGVDATAQFTVSLNVLPDGDLVLGVDTMGSSATEPSDFTAPDDRFMFPRDATTLTRSLTVTIQDDPVVEQSEAFVLNLTLIAGTTLAGTELGTASATVTIRDTDRTEFSIQGPTALVREGGDAKFTVSLTNAIQSAAATTVQWQVSIVDPIENRDFDDGEDRSGVVTFPMNVTTEGTQPISINIAEDMRPEAAETFEVTISNPAHTDADLSSRLEIGTATATATIAGEVGVPTVTPSTGSGYGLVVTWMAAENDTGLTGYEVQYRQDGTTTAYTSHTPTGNATTTTIDLGSTLTGATAVYEVQVRPIYGAVAGSWSASGRGSASEAPVVSIRPSINEHTQPNLLLSVTDNDNINESFTYTLAAAGTSNDNDQFVLDTNATPVRVQFSNAPDFESPASQSSSNTYTLHLTVADSFGTQALVRETVVVNNVQETGTLELSTRTPSSGMAVTADLMDPDGVTPNTAKYQWAASSTGMGSTWEDIAGATMASFTPTAAHEEQWLQVTVRYDDGAGTGQNLAATATAATADGIIPTIATGGISIISAPLVGDTYLQGETIQVQVQFSEPVQLTGTAGIAIGINGGDDVYATATDDGTTDATDTWVFAYVVAANVADAVNGVDIVADTLALRSPQSMDRLFYDGADNAVVASMNPVHTPTSQQNIDGTRTHPATTVTIESPTEVHTTGDAFPVTITFSRPVSGFTGSDIAVQNGTVESFQVSIANERFTVNVAPRIMTGTVTVTVAPNQFPWTALDSVLNDGDVLTVNVDRVAPTVMFTPSTTALREDTPFTLTISFGEAVTGFDVSALSSPQGATFASFMSESGTPGNYTVTVTPTQIGTLEVVLANNVVMDVNGNRVPAATFRGTVAAANPTVTLRRADGLSPPVRNTFDVIATFSETVTGFDELSMDVTVTGGRLLAITQGATADVYTLRIRPTTHGTVTIAVPANRVMGDDSGTGNLESDSLEVAADLPVAVTFGMDEYGITEGGDAGTIAVSATPAAEAPTSIVFAITYEGQGTIQDLADDPAAAGGIEHLTGNRYSVNLASGNATIPLAAVVDDDWEPADRVILTLIDTDTAWPDGAHVGMHRTTTVSITDSRMPPSITLTVTPNALAERGGQTMATIRATVNNTNPHGRFVESHTLRLILDENTAKGALNTAPDPDDEVDFTVPTITIDVPAGDMTVLTEVPLTVVPDNQGEGIGPFTIDGQVETIAGMVVGDVSVIPAMGTIADTSAMSIRADQKSIAEPASGRENVTFTVALTATPAVPIALMATVGGSVDTQDYDTAATLPVTFAANTTELQQRLTIPVLADDVAEATESLKLTLSFSGTPVPDIIGSGASGKMDITDMDTTTVAITKSPADAVGEGGRAVFEVTLSRAIGTEVTVPWSIVHGDTDNADFSTGVGMEQVVFAASDGADTVRTIEVQIATDSDDNEGAESFTVQLETPTGMLGTRATYVLNQRTGAATIAPTPAGPGAPTVAPTPGHGYGLAVTWDAPTPADGVTGYDVGYRPAGTTEDYTDAMHTGTDTEIDIPINLEEGATPMYEVRVRTEFDDERKSLWSAPGSGSANEIPTFGGTIPRTIPALNETNDFIGQNGFSFGDPDITGMRPPIEIDFEGANGDLFKFREPGGSSVNPTYRLVFKDENGYDYEARPCGSNHRCEIEIVLTDAFGGEARGAVTVTLVNSAEMESLTGLPPTAERGVSITAEITGGDTPQTPSWSWFRTPTLVAPTSSDWVQIPEADAATYTPTTADSMQYLMVRVRYRDLPDEGIQSLEFRITNPVKANSAPSFTEAILTHTLAENSLGDVAVGTVAAMDVNGDDLTYTLGGTDAAQFELDAATGQISTKAGVDYDYEDADNRQYSVTVQADDGYAGGTATVTVTINLDNVIENGEITLPDTAPMVGSNIEPMLMDGGGTPTAHRWQWQVSDNGMDTWTDIPSGNYQTYVPVAAQADKYLRVTVTYASPEPGQAGQRERATSDPTAAVVAATNPINAPATLTLTLRENERGDLSPAEVGRLGITTSDLLGEAIDHTIVAGDTTKFSLPNDILLYIGEGEDYERQPSHTVRVRTTQGDFTAYTVVTVQITNADDPGAVTIKPSGPVVPGRWLRATLADQDGGVTAVQWQWQEWDPIDMEWDDIRGATRAAVVPRVNLLSQVSIPGVDTNTRLRVMVTYRDRLSVGNADRRTASAATGNVQPATGSTITGLQPFTSAELPERNPELGGTAQRVFLLSYDPIAANVSANQFTYAVLAGNEDNKFEITAQGDLYYVGMGEDYETRVAGGHPTAFELAVAVRHGMEAATTITTVRVINVDEPGTLDVTGAPAMVGQQLTAMLQDEDGDTRDVTWGWSRLAADATPADDGQEVGFTHTYTPTRADVGHHLEVSVVYRDGVGDDQHNLRWRTAATVPAPDDMANHLPTFGDPTEAVPDSDPLGPTVVHYIGTTLPENTAGAGSTPVAITTVRATDADDPTGMNLTYDLFAGDPEDRFAVDGTSGAVTYIGPGEDFETDPISHILTIRVTDDQLAEGYGWVFVPVGNVEEDETVTLTTVRSADRRVLVGPRVGAVTTATLDGGDAIYRSSVGWQWQRGARADTTNWTDIAGGIARTYTPTTADAGQYLRAVATYRDTIGDDSDPANDPATAYGVSAAPVAAGFGPQATFAAPTTGLQVGTAFELTIRFGEAVTGFELGDLSSPQGANIQNLQFNPNVAGEYTVSVTPTVEGTLQVVLTADAVTDATGTYTVPTRTFTGMVDLIPVTTAVARVGSVATAVGPFVVAVTFSEAVAGFDVDNEVTLSDNATITAHAEVTTGTVWHVLVSPTAAGPVTITVAEGVGTATRSGAQSGAAALTVDAALLTVSFGQTSYPATEGGTPEIAVELAQEPENLTPTPHAFAIPLVIDSQTDGLPTDVTGVTVPGAGAWESATNSLTLSTTGTTTTMRVALVAADELWAPARAIPFQLLPAAATGWPAGFAHGDTATTDITVTDSRLPPTIALTLSQLALAEVAGVSVATIGATIRAEATQGFLAEDLTLHLDFPGTGTHPATRGMAADEGDYHVDATTITLPMGTTPMPAEVRLRVRGDGEDEPQAEQIVIGAHVTAEVGGAPIPEFTIAEQMITVHDALVADIAADAATVTESAATTATFTVTLNVPPAAALELGVTTTGSTATPADFTAPTSPITFAAGTGTLTATVTVAVADDPIVEPDETLVLHLSPTGQTPAGAVFGMASATVTIMDDDTTTIALGAPVPNIVAEGATATFPVTLAAPIGAPLRVDWTVTAGADPAADPATDFSSASGFITIPAGAEFDSTHPIAIPVATDAAADEDAENFVVTIAIPTTEALASRVTVSPDATATATIFGTGSPPAISSLAASAGEGYGLDVAWTRPHRTAGLTGYAVEYRAQGETEFTAHAFDARTRTTTIDLTTAIGTEDEFDVRVRGVYGTEVGVWSDLVTRSANEPPAITVGTTAVDENAADVALLTFMDPDVPMGTLTPALTGVDAAAFAIGLGAAHQPQSVQFAEPPDFERPTDAGVHAGNNWYTANLTVTDPFGATATAALAIEVNNVNEAEVIALQPATAHRGTPITARLADGDAVTRTLWRWYRAPDATPRVWAFTGTFGASYTPRAADVGQVLEVRADYTDTFGDAQRTQETAAVVGDVAPTFAPALTTGVTMPENPLPGAAIGDPFTATDANGDAVTYALTGTDATAFTIDAATGQLHARAGVDYDHESGQTMYALTVTATDGTNPATELPITVTLTDVDETGTSLALDPAPTVGQLTTAVRTTTATVDAAAPQFHRWQVRADSAAAWQDIPGATFRSYAPAGAQAGMELRAQHSFGKDDGSGERVAVWTAAATIAGTGTPPAIPAHQVFELAENQSGMTDAVTLGPIAITAPGSATLAILAGNPDHRFALDGQTLQYVGPGEDHETTAAYTLHMQITAGTLVGTGVVTVAIGNADEPGTIALTPLPPRSSRRITARLMDPDGGIMAPQWQWEHSVDAGASWQGIAGATRADYIPTGAEGAAGAWLRVRATYRDASDPAARRTATSPATPPVGALTAAAPGLIPFRRLQLAEAVDIQPDQLRHIVLGSFQPTHTHLPADQFIYRIVDSDAGARFEFRRELLYYVGIGENFEDFATPAHATYPLLVEVSRGDDVARQNVTIAITNVNEPGTLTLDPAAPTMGDAVTATLTDPDSPSGAGVTVVSWSWQRRQRDGNGDLIATMAIGGATAAQYTPTVADVDHRLAVTVLYRDPAGNGIQSARAETTTPVPAATAGANQVPAFTATADTHTQLGTDPDDPQYVHYQATLAENLTGTPPVALVTVTATDADAADTVTYRIIAGNPHAHFALDPASGALTYVGPGEDHEALLPYPAHLLTVAASDGTGHAQASVEIQIVDIQEEDGAVGFHPMQPASGQPITASITDGDGVRAGSPEWQWQRGSQYQAVGWHNIPGATTATHTPRRSDEGQYLRMVAHYEDNFDPDDETRWEVIAAIPMPVADGLGPVVRTARIASTPRAGTTSYGVGDEIVIELVFSEPVVLHGTAWVTLQIGTASRTAAATGTAADAARSVLQFRYPVAAGDAAAAGVAVVADSLALVDAATLADSAGNAATRTHPAVTGGAAHAVDGSMDSLGPTVTITGPERAHGAFDLTVEFSEPVTGFAASQLTVGGGTAAALTAVTPGRVYTTRITPRATVPDDVVVIQVAADAVADGAGNRNMAAEWLVRLDRMAPTVAIATTPGSPVRADFQATITFAEAVTGFTVDDLAVAGGATLQAGTLTTVIPGRRYTVDVAVPTADGEVGITVAAGAVTDAVGNPNAATTATVTVDRTRPTVTIASTAPAPVTGAFEVTLTFSESVHPLTADGVTVTNGNVESLVATASPSTIHRVGIVPAGHGDVTVSVNGNAATDRAGNGNLASPTPFRVRAVLTGITTSIRVPPGPVSGPFPVTVTFATAVQGFEVADVVVGGPGTKSNFTASPVAGEAGRSFTLTVTPTATGTVSLAVAAAVATATADRSRTNQAARTQTVAADLTPPGVTLTPATVGPVHGDFDLTIAFDEMVAGFHAADLDFGAGTRIAHFRAVTPGREYRATVQPPMADGRFTITVPAGAARDAAGWPNATTELAWVADRTAPAVAIRGPEAAVHDDFDITVTVSEPVSLGRPHVQSQPGGKVDPSRPVGTGERFTATVTIPAADGWVRVGLPAGTVTDAAGNRPRGHGGVPGHDGSGGPHGDHHQPGRCRRGWPVRGHRDLLRGRGGLLGGRPHGGQRHGREWGGCGRYRHHVHHAHHPPRRWRGDGDGGGPGWRRMAPVTRTRPPRHSAPPPP